MNYNWLAKFYIYHPVLILTGIAVISGICFVVPFSVQTILRFSDPLSGFETRGTRIADRIVTWQNLIDAVKESGDLTVNPKEYLYRRNYTTATFSRNRRNVSEQEDDDVVYGKLKFYSENVTDTPGSKLYKLKEALNLPPRTENEHLLKDNKFCGLPNEGYAHAVLEAGDGSDLFTLDKMHALCRIEGEFTNSKHFNDLCIRTGPEDVDCCTPWSIAGYIAFIRNKPSCLDIDEEDVKMVKSILQNCSVYFHNFVLHENCVEDCECPDQCVTHNIVFTVFNYLADTSFIPVNFQGVPKLQKTTIFLPVAASTATLPYYHELELKNLTSGGVSVVGMSFGIRNALFDEYIVRDIRLMCPGGLFVLICMWLYTGSLFLTVMSTIAIVFGLIISYVLYTFAFGVQFFPFMNLLAAVVILGIGADGIFIFCKMWDTMKKTHLSKFKIMAETLRHSVVSILITCLTTAAAFAASFSSSITTVRCFSVFATTSVLADGLLMLLWFPACVIIWERVVSKWSESFQNCTRRLANRFSSFFRWLATNVFGVSRDGRLLNDSENLLIDSIITYRLSIFTVLTFVSCISTIIVFFYPKMQLPSSSNFQLFDSSHVFEKYELVYRSEFWFSKERRMDPELVDRLPLRFVWGVKPQDNGDYLQPESIGTLDYDEVFNMSHPDSQEWLLTFCSSLKKQPFYKSSWDPLGANCFIEWFKKWMDKPCYDPMEMTYRTPCCRNETFPFKSSVFDFCIVEAVDELQATPPAYLRSGFQGLKFSKDLQPVVKAVVIEEDSNYIFSVSYDYMNEFDKKIEEWFSAQLLTAPLTMQGGWFTSDLRFYDLQRVLSQCTFTAVAISMALAMSVIFATTMNILISFFAIINITSSIVVTMSILVLLNWELNVLESIAISSAIGLTVDFSLHYALSYQLAPAHLLRDRVEATKYALSKMFQPVTMAALTTGMVGAFMMPSSVLPYIKIGTFLVVVMCVSWLYSTFHLGALLALAGPQDNFGQCRLDWFRRRPEPLNADSRNRRNAIADVHELRALTTVPAQDQNNDTPGTSRPPEETSMQDLDIPLDVPDHSPSETSAATAVMGNDK